MQAEEGDGVVWEGESEEEVVVVEGEGAETEVWEVLVVSEVI